MQLILFLPIAAWRTTRPVGSSAVASIHHLTFLYLILAGCLSIIFIWRRIWRRHSFHTSWSILQHLGIRLRRLPILLIILMYSILENFTASILLFSWTLLWYTNIDQLLSASTSICCYTCIVYFSIKSCFILLRFRHDHAAQTTRTLGMSSGFCRPHTTHIFDILVSAVRAIGLISSFWRTLIHHLVWSIEWCCIWNLLTLPVAAYVYNCRASVLHQLLHFFFDHFVVVCGFQ